MNKLIAGLIHAIGALTVYTLVSPLWAVMYLGFLVGVMNERLSTKDEVELNER